MNKANHVCRYCKEKVEEYLKRGLCESCYGNPFIRSRYIFTTRELEQRRNWDLKVRLEEGGNFGEIQEIR